MTNYESNPDKIKAAYASGIITPTDYRKWQGLQGYKNAIKKATDLGEISKGTYSNEYGKANGFYWERDLSSGTFKYKLVGQDFVPLDLIGEQKIQKSNLVDDFFQIEKSTRSLQLNKSVMAQRKLDSAVSTITDLAAKVSGETKRMKEKAKNMYK